MQNSDSQLKRRRDLLRLAGGGVAFITLGGLAACSDDEPAATSARNSPGDELAPRPKPEPTAPMEDRSAAGDTTQPATETATAKSGLPHLSEDNPQAQALGYKHDTTDVDGSRYSNHAPEQVCRNCTLYSGKAGEEWGPCGIFPAYQVNAEGWCSAYNPQTG